MSSELVPLLQLHNYIYTVQLGNLEEENRGELLRKLECIKIDLAQ